VVSPLTVRNHLTNILAKLGVTTAKPPPKSPAESA